ncbi:hypothetical protein AVEN_158836-1 [Araneus ventricosus]|uniref:Uncharacterized protein n=1 Tax=Araneus ventricosus TaxID=182803 RepID=A0A4Y2WHT0_ARAVE|nr:hypothetical protein AVEN_253947-1 [Araneus ventricosus]GBO35968.1 hypothetical protein AVEN_266195-1 [Araneus ventricosus]GBO35972.1 hypothetical protein AVEN_76327-1 [Araneus ventricosus]GBO35979.1 hypothetical protein AVEN_158836-1 [Araneus ventricosus]
MILNDPAATSSNSIDMGPSHTPLQAKDDNRPKRPNVTLKFPPLSLSVIDFTPAGRAFFVRVARPDVFGEEGSFLTIWTAPAVIVVFEGKSEFPSSLIEELGRSRILRSLYFNDLKNQKVNQSLRTTHYGWHMRRPLRQRYHTSSIGSNSIPHHLLYPPGSGYNK